MPTDRFFIDTPNLKEGVATLEGEEFHHLKNVMRLREGDELECFNGKGFLAHGRVETLGKKEAEITIEKVFFEPPSAYPLILAQAFIRTSKLDFVVEKGVELGMNKLYIFHADHSEKGTLSENQHRRLHTLLVNACKQSGQLWLPEVVLLKSIKDFPVGNDTLFYGDTRKDAPLLKDKLSKKNSVAFFVGPEKGFSEKETAWLENVGAIGVKIARLILRTETAPLAALALLGHLFDENLKPLTADR